ncbi:hypothetical protein DFP73DRAFT_532689 [Morchella snyderi]|nr:hypothetical protein DFP73DRAFT_532689 [Morchella snyderi]
MSSDADYAAFLKKSQKDYSQSYEEDSSKQAATTTASTAQSEVHPAVRALGERFYVSDADEPFEGVSFAWDKGTLPTEDEFGDLIGVQSGREIKQLEPNKWDAHGEYQDVIEAVTKASSGSVVKVYRVEGAGSRVEYFVVGVDSGEGKVVGVKVLSIES